MPTVRLSYRLPEEQEELSLAMRGPAYSRALSRIGEEIFRPVRKHGYADRVLSDAVMSVNPDVTEIIGLLEEAYYGILREEGLLDE